MGGSELDSLPRVPREKSPTPLRMSVPFPKSTHAKFWLFASAAELDEKRQATHDAAVRSIASLAPAEGEVLAPLPPRADMYLLCAHYEKKLQELCRDENSRDATRFTNRVLCTALVFLKRFYLRVSPMEEEPKGMMLATIYLAGKVEEERIKISDLVPKYEKKLGTEGLIALEMKLLDTLHFQLVVRSPFRCLTGLLQDLYSESASSDADAAKRLESLHQGADEHVRRALLSDAPLLCSPQQIALSALLAASKAAEGESSAGELDIRPWIERRFATADADSAGGGGSSSDATGGGEGGGGAAVAGEVWIVLDQVERTCACLPDLGAEGTTATLKATDGRLRKLGKHLKRVEKANADQRAGEEKERRQQQRQARAAEKAAETERLSAKVDEARAEAKAALSAPGVACGEEAIAGEAFEVRKRRKLDEHAAVKPEVKSEGPP